MLHLTISMKNPFLLILSLCVVFGIAACKKKQSDIVVEDHVKPELDFEFSGKLYVYTPVIFKTNLKESADLTWYFNDVVEKTVYGTETSYTYDKAGTYKVTLAVADGIGGTVSKFVTISNGGERVSGMHDWHFFLKRTKYGHDASLIPTDAFTNSISLKVVDDTTIQIPDIPQMRLRGPYIVNKHSVTDSVMIYKSQDMLMELSYTYHNSLAGMKIIQVYKDTTWKLDGLANIYN